MKNQYTRSAWVLMLSSAAILAITMGARQSSGLFVSPLNTSTGLGIVSISFALAVGQFVWGLAQPIFGAIADKKGSYGVLIMGAFLLAGGRGIPVALGGPHVSLLPDEAEKHSDVILIGEAEDTWKEFLIDFENKSFKKRYIQKHPSSLVNLPMARKDLFHRKDHSDGIIVSQLSLDHANKSFNKVEDYYKIIKRIHSYGISVQVGIIFGFDEDDEKIFSKTITFLEAAGVQNATFNMLIPYPGIPLFKRLENEGRMINL